MANDLPEMFDTDFYLARWWRSYNGDLAKIEKYMREYLTNRKLFSYDVEDVHHQLITSPIASRAMKYFSVSRMNQMVRSSGDCCMFAQRMKGCDLKQVLSAPCRRFGQAPSPYNKGTFTRRETTKLCGYFQHFKHIDDGLLGRQSDGYRSISIGTSIAICYSTTYLKSVLKCRLKFCNSSRRF